MKSKLWLILSAAAIVYSATLIVPVGVVKANLEGPHCCFSSNDCPKGYVCKWGSAACDSVNYGACQ